MGLFDVLRYHVSDIYNEQEINALPIELVRSWLIECLVDVELNFVNKLNIETWTKVSPITIPTIVNFYASRLSFIPGRSSYVVPELVKAQFTLILQHKILHYDEDIVDGIEFTK